jgi:hypothetical protein
MSRPFTLAIPMRFLLALVVITAAILLLGVDVYSAVVHLDLPIQDQPEILDLTGALDFYLR